MRARLRLSAAWEELRGSLWLLPSLFVIAALVSGTVLSRWRPFEGTGPGLVVFGGTASSAREILSMIAGAMITVTGLTFSLTVVALQMASAQFSPRVLREFLTDRGNQLVLGAFLATFAYCVAVIRVIRDEGAPGGEVLPQVAVTVGIALTFVAVGALVYFIHHLTQQLRADAILREIVTGTLRTIDKVHPDPVDEGHQPRALPEPPQGTYQVRAQRSGYLQAVQVEGMLHAAEACDVIVRIRPPVGAYVAEGTTLAWVWAAGSGADSQAHVHDERLDRVAHDHVHLGPERTLQQDVPFGLRQIVDIAARALSPGVNDPTTAIDALGSLTVALVRLATRRLGTLVHLDPQGRVRAVVPRPDFADYLALACDQPRRYGAKEPAVVLALMGLLTDVAEVVSRESDRAAVATECARTVEVAATALDDTDMTRVRVAAAQVQETLSGGRRPQPEVAAG